MNQEDIIRMAREAGFHSHYRPEMYDCMVASHADIERFAALVAAKYEEKIQDLEDMIQELQEREE